MHHRPPYRAITRWANEEAAERNRQRVMAHPQVISRRKEIVEHIFGTLRNWGYDKFLLRGLRKVRAEFSLSALTYNLRRVFNLLSCEDLIKALQNQSIAPSGAAV